jgi:hypothetical protein
MLTLPDRHKEEAHRPPLTLIDGLLPLQPLYRTADGNRLGVNHNDFPNGKPLLMQGIQREGNYLRFSAKSSN